MSAVDHVYKALKSKILAQEYLPGAQLKEMQISRELAATRTPVREAIIRLEREGLVRTVYNRGAFVTVFSPEEIEDLFEVREALEAKALALAIRRANRDEVDSIERALRRRELRIKSLAIKQSFDDPELDFHLAIIRLSKNERLISIWQAMQSQLSLVRVTSTMRKRRYLKALDEHKKILAFMRGGDTTKAVRLLIRHLACDRNNLLSSLADGADAPRTGKPHRETGEKGHTEIQANM